MIPTTQNSLTTSLSTSATNASTHVSSLSGTPSSGPAGSATIVATGVTVPTGSGTSGPTRSWLAFDLTLGYLLQLLQRPQELTLLRRWSRRPRLVFQYLSRCRLLLRYSLLREISISDSAVHAIIVLLNLYTDFLGCPDGIPGYFDCCLGFDTCIVVFTELTAGIPDFSNDGALYAMSRVVDPSSHF